MPKTASVRVPSYRLHRATGQAVVTVSGRDFYLGKHGSAASRHEYNRLIAEWTAGNGTLPKATSDTTVAELLVAFMRAAKGTHSKKDLENFALAMRPLKALYARTSVEDFGPLSLKAVRQKMIEADLARKTINDRTNRLRFVFKWGVENELVPPSVLHGLQAVAGLRFGRSEARETQPVKPVPQAFVEAVLAYVSPPVAAMIRLQCVTGMRSGEVCIMRGRDIDASGKVWVYTVPTHKGSWRGHERKVYLGPQAQEIVRPYLKTDLDAYLFSPAEAMLRIWEARHERRRTPLSCGNRPGTNRKGVLKLSKRYNPDSYRRAIEHGIAAANRARLAEAEAAGIPADRVQLVSHWHPHQLRHNAATNLRREHGIEVARIILGHRSPAVTEIYAEADCARAIAVMAEVG